MSSRTWPTRRLSVASLLLDTKNPRLGLDGADLSQREVIQYLFERDKALEVARSIVVRGYFPNEPLLGVREAGHYVVVEGNRRLAALKALREPSLLSSRFRRSVERLARRVADPEDVARVPLTIAPSRRATDRQVAGRHLGTAVLAWQAENRASFILEKLAEGYSNDQLRDELGFKLGDIQKARQTKAIAEMTRSLELPAEVRERVQNPRAKLLSTLERVFDSSMGKSFLMVEADPDHGLKGTTTKKEFLRGFTKLVTDIAMGKQSSRTLNKGENIEEYFDTWMPEDRPAKKRGSFVPADIIEGRSVEPLAMKPKPAPKRSRDVSATVIPKSLKVRYGHERLVDIRDELCKLKRAETPNAGAVLLRVFLELSILDYLRRSGELQGLVADLERKQSRVPHGVPTLRQLLPAITAMAKRRLSQDEARTVEKALRPDKAAPFTLGDLHAFVHSVVDLPGENDIRQFWLRTEPLFRLMLEQELEGEE